MIFNYVNIEMKIITEDDLFNCSKSIENVCTEKGVKLGAVTKSLWSTEIIKLKNVKYILFQNEKRKSLFTSNKHVQEETLYFLHRYLNVSQQLCLY